MVMIMDRTTLIENAIEKKVKFEEIIVNKKVKFEPLIIKKKILDAVFNIHAHAVNSGGSIEVLYGTPEEPVSLHDERFTKGESKMYFICGCISDFPEDSEAMIIFDVAANEEPVYKLFVQKMGTDVPQYLVTLDMSDYLNANGLGEYPSLFYDIFYDGEWWGWYSTTYGSFTKSLLGYKTNPVDLTNLDMSYIYKIFGFIKETPTAFKNSGYVVDNKLRVYLYVINGENSNYPTIYLLGDKIFTQRGGNSLDDIKEFKPLPDVTTDDNGKVLMVEDGQWIVKSIN